MGKIRFLLALSVVAVHCGPIWKFYMLGGDAVQVFFVISGFYMSLVLNEKYTGINASYKLFITNRFLRLAPIYWVVLFSTMILCLIIGKSSGWANFPIFGSYFLVTHNFFSIGYLVLTSLFIWGQDLVLLMGINPVTGNLYFTTEFLKTFPPLYSFMFIPQAWSLGLELAFYALAPLILKKGFKLVGLLMALSLMVRLLVFFYWGLRNDPWSYRFFPSELMFFLLGYLSYRIYLFIKDIKIPGYINSALLYLVLAFTLSYSFLPGTSVHIMQFSFKLMCYHALLVVSIPLLFKYLKNDKLDAQIGELSYPIYISHIFVAMFLKSITSGPLSSGWAIALFTIILSLGLIKFIAAPMERYRQRRLTR
nr:acyltransferase [uncultured Mucilaginibacter sp.]